MSRGVGFGAAGLAMGGIHGGEVGCLERELKQGGRWTVTVMLFLVYRTNLATPL